MKNKKQLENKSYCVKFRGVIERAQFKTVFVAAKTRRRAVLNAISFLVNGDDNALVFFDLYSAVPVVNDAV